MTRIAASRWNGFLWIGLVCAAASIASTGSAALSWVQHKRIVTDLQQQHDGLTQAEDIVLRMPDGATFKGPYMDAESLDPLRSDEPVRVGVPVGTMLFAFGAVVLAAVAVCCMRIALTG